MSSSNRLHLISVYPDLLGTYGDGGNAEVLGWRARQRGFEVRHTIVRVGQAVPDSGDLYVLGGGEDAAQAVAAEDLRGPRGRGLRRAVAAGQPVFAVCAGYQILGAQFVDPTGAAVAGLGLLDAVSVRGPGRAIGEVVVEPRAELSLGRLSGFENHAGRTVLGSETGPLGRVLAGVGNSEGARADGAWSGRLLATYLHGPVLARNRDLADLVLGWAVGELPPLAEATPDQLADALRIERIAAGLRLARLRRHKAVFRSRRWRADADAAGGATRAPAQGSDSTLPWLP